MNFNRPKDFFYLTTISEKINRSIFVIQGIMPSKFFIYLDYHITHHFKNLYQLTIKNCVTTMKVKELEGGEDSKANM